MIHIVRKLEIKIGDDRWYVKATRATVRGSILNRLYTSRTEGLYRTLIVSDWFDIFLGLNRNVINERNRSIVSRI
jgi:hypothetical protein